MTRRRLISTLWVSVCLSLVGLLSTAPSAQAAALYTSNCLQDRYVCMFYNDYLNGANLGVYNDVPDFANPKKYFPKNCGLESDGRPRPSCAGQGKQFWNDVASAQNCDDSHRATIWYNQNYGGPAVTMGNATTDGSYVSLQSTHSKLWNNNRALSFAYAPGPPNSNECFLG